MKRYKQLIKSDLYKNGWEIQKIEDNTDWWLEEYWKIISVKQNWGQILYILFLVDPQYEGNKKSEAIRGISAMEEIPVSRPNDDGVAFLSMSSGNYNENLENFILKLNTFRSSRHVQ